MAKRYWLMKSEPDAYSIDDLDRDGVTAWEGVRNYQARNLLRDEIRVGDGVLFYHSSTQPPGVIGLAEVVHESYPDRSQFDPASPYFDPKSTPEAPRWFVVDVRFVERFAAVVPLAVLQTTPGLEGMLVTKKGMRLSVQPVTPEEWGIVVAMGRATSAEAAPSASRNHGTRAAARAPARKTASATRASAKPTGTKQTGAKPTGAKPAATKPPGAGKAGTKVAARKRQPGRARRPAGGR
jgi:predicted RNA-binding protein with PUA-like domain